jgi:hypothetical protein
MDQIMATLRTVADGQVELLGEVKEMRGEHSQRLKALERRVDDHDESLDSLRPQVAVLQDSRRRNSPSAGILAVRAPLPSTPDADATGKQLARAVELEAEQARDATKLRAQQWKTIAPAVKIIAAAIACGASATLAVRCNADAAVKHIMVPMPMVVGSSASTR